MNRQKFVFLISVSLLTLPVLVLALVFEDSNVFTFQTRESTKPPEVPYGLSCFRSEDNKEMTIQWWNGARYNPHDIEIYGAKVDPEIYPSPPLSVLPNSKKSSSPPTGDGFLHSVPAGDYPHGNLEAISTYQYQLEVIYVGTRPSERFPDSPIICPPREFITDAPSNLNAWTRSSTTLFINWKDNAVREHTFLIERIKITPETPAFTYPGSTPGSFQKVETKSESELEVFWQNDTNRKQYKSPYRHLIERSTSSEPFADRDKDGNFDPTKGKPLDQSFTSFDKSFDEDKTYAPAGPNTTAKNLYNFTNMGLAEATIYSYRIKGCSLILVDLTKDDVENFNPPICSKYSPTFEKNTTKPAKPLNLTAVLSDPRTVELSWTDDSNGEDGFVIYRNNIFLKSVGLAAGRGTTVFASDSGLSSGTSYTYKVTAYKFNPNYPNNFNKKVESAYSNEVQVTTMVTLSVSKSGSGSGIVSSTDATINCGSICSGDYIYGTNITLNAATTTIIASSTFEGWGGACASFGANTTCSLTMDSDKNVTARFGVIGEGQQQAFFAKNLIASVIDSAESLFGGIKSAFNKVWYGFLEIVRGFFRPETLAQIRSQISDEEIDRYFGQFVKNGNDPNIGQVVQRMINLSTYEDTGLEPNTVYLYRVKTIYTNPAGESEYYSELRAGKTLLADAELKQNEFVSICTRNSFCQGGFYKYSSSTVFGEVKSEHQCDNNAGCRDVGTSRQFFEETR